MRPVETAETEEQRLARFEAVLTSLYAKWLAGDWRPQYEEVLFTLLEDGETVFAWESVPPEAELCAGCEQYQRTRGSLSYKEEAPRGLDAAARLAYYRRHILAIRSRRGQDVCWEVDGLFRALPQWSEAIDPEKHASERERLRRCSVFRRHVYEALAARESQKAGNGCDGSEAPQA